VYFIRHRFSHGEPVPATRHRADFRIRRVRLRDLGPARDELVAGIHFRSLDRDVDCPLGSSSATRNSYATAGTWGFTNRFIAGPGL
jgi:hypothetical protein